MKSKIDQSDPNPAHLLKSSIADLTKDSKQGREINPRFSSPRSSPRPVFQRRSTIDYNADRFPRSSGLKRSPLAEYRYQRSGSLDSPLEVKPKQRGLETSPQPWKERASSKIPFKMSRVVKRANPLLASQGIAEEAEEEEEEDVLSGASVSSELEHRTANPDAFTEENDCETSDEEEEEEDGFSGSPSTCGGVVMGSGGICGMEVTSNGTETTVVLKHLLALSDSHSSPSSHDASTTIVEEDELEEDYYKSQDTPVSTSEIAFRLPHPIPRLIVTCEGEVEEGEGLVETVVETARYYHEALASELGLITEHEDEECGPLSTRL